MRSVVSPNDVGCLTPRRRPLFIKDARMFDRYSVCVYVVAPQFGIIAPQGVLTNQEKLRATFPVFSPLSANTRTSHAERPGRDAWRGAAAAAVLF